MTSTRWNTHGAALTYISPSQQQMPQSNGFTDPLETKTLAELKEWRSNLQQLVDNGEGGSSITLIRKKRIQKIGAKIEELEAL
jgi:hypothetical protein